MNIGIKSPSSIKVNEIIKACKKLSRDEIGLVLTMSISQRSDIVVPNWFYREDFNGTESQWKSLLKEKDKGWLADCASEWFDEYVKQLAKKGVSEKV